MSTSQSTAPPAPASSDAADTSDDSSDSLEDLLSNQDGDISPSELATGNDEDAANLYKNATAHSTCYFPGAFAIPLVDPTTRQIPSCALGFYCPNNTEARPLEYCPPSPSCQVTRLAGGQCKAQGKYEPVVCPSGHYCPPGGKELLECPAGNYCPLGSYKPRPCGPGASCPRGAEKRIDYYGLIILIILDVALLAGLLMARFWRRHTEAPRIRKKRRLYSMLPGNWPAMEKGNGEDEENRSGVRTPLAVERPRDVMLNRAQTWGSQVTRKLSKRVAKGAGKLFPPLPKPVVHDSDDEAMEATELMINARKRESTSSSEEEEGGQDLKDLMQSFRKSIDGSSLGLTFAFQQLGFTLKTGRVLMADVTGSIPRGTTWGVMGPSGAGKTTFMSVLMGKVQKTKGALHVNGVLQKNMKQFKRVIGYVPQDDIVLPELTVRENILHSARIRLPCTWKEADIQRHVDLVIACLSLTHVKDSQVGDAAKRGISGGQRKRVNIGIELAAAPMALFLDEPTSGLDSTGALQVAKLLQSISRLGVTVVSVIHQPRTEIFDCFDNIVLIAGGRQIWHGERVGMLEYFQQQGFNFKPQHNPADVIMDIISGKGFRHRDFLRENEVQYLISQWAERRPEVQLPTHKSPSSPADAAVLSRTIKARGAYWYRQLYLCFNRSLLQQHRQSSSFLLELFVAGIAGTLMGFTMNSMDGHLFQSTYLGAFVVFSSWLNLQTLPQIGLIAGIAIALAGSPSGVKVFGEEKLVYWREAATGHNRFSYYAGKVLSTVFRIAIAALHFSVFFALLATPVIPFSNLYLIIVLNFYCVYGLASIVSMLVKKEDGPLLAVIVGLIMAVFCGYGPSLKKVDQWHMQWFWRLMPGTWFAEALVSENVLPFKELYQVQTVTAKTGYVLGQFGKDVGGMALIGTVYRIIAFLGLIGLRRDKQR